MPQFQNSANSFRFSMQLVRHCYNFLCSIVYLLPVIRMLVGWSKVLSLITLMAVFQHSKTILGKVFTQTLTGWVQGPEYPWSWTDHNFRGLIQCVAPHISIPPPDLARSNRQWLGSYCAGSFSRERLQIVRNGRVFLYTMLNSSIHQLSCILNS